MRTGVEIQLASEDRVRLERLAAAVVQQVVTKTTTETPPAATR
jgi:hypothetical protein